MSNNTSVGSLRAYLAALIFATVLIIVWIQKPFTIGIKSPVVSFDQWNDETVTVKAANQVSTKTVVVTMTPVQNTHIVSNASLQLPGVGSSRVYPFSPELQAELDRRLAEATEKKTILVWIPMFGSTLPINLNTSRCGNCEVTYNHNKIQDNTTAAIVFHFHSVSAATMPPKDKRNPSHLYIYWVKEAPPSLKMRGKSLDFEDSCHFNATMGFRSSSDFVDDYQIPVLVGDMIPKDGINLTQLLNRKTKKGVAVVSNCGITPGAKTRMRLIKDIKSAGFAVETFGACFRGSGAFAAGAGRGSDKFYQAVQQYKFYFSFENSHRCKDYVTEKFFNNALFSRAVPVAWGASKEDYETLAPPGSFIHVEDFPSIKDLVDYLNYLDKNDTAYLEYFRWLTMKPEEMPRYGRERSFCAICRAVHGINIDDVFNSKYDPSNPPRPMFSDGMAKRNVDSIKNWYYGEENGECFRP